jgi:predicted dehydrogenase
MRHFKECIHGAAKPQVGGAEGTLLMQMIDAIYKSAASGRSVEVRSEAAADKTAEAAVSI